MDKEYFWYREEQAVQQFPDLVKTVGFTAASAELILILSDDQLLCPEDVLDIAEEAQWRYFDDRA